tara:strand:- start:379 stop:492 length:114 start_codon:yes stop_codon:yes gene_type:complete
MEKKGCLIKVVTKKFSPSWWLKKNSHQVGGEKNLLQE